MLRAGGLGVRDLRRLAQAFDTDETTAGLLADLAHAAGLVAPSSDFDQVWLPTPKSDAWRRLEPADRWTTIATTWLSTTRVAALIGAGTTGTARFPRWAVTSAGRSRRR